MHVNNQLFIPYYVNPVYYSRIRQENALQQYKDEQWKEVKNAVNAIHDLCHAVKKLDETHQKQAFNLCIVEIAREMNW